MASEKVTVQPGQTWRDMDKRTNGRCLRVERIEPGSRYHLGYTVDDPKAILRHPSGRETKVAVRRMETGSRWKMVRDENGRRVDESAAPTSGDGQ